MNRRVRGFTLIELMVVVAIIAIMLAIAAPSFTSFISNYRATAAINDVLQGISLTRSEAMKRGRRVTLAPIANDWRNGWAVFMDAPTGALHNQTLDAGEEVIFRHDALPTSIAVSSPAGGSPFADPLNARSFIAFDGTGYARASDGNAAALGGYGIVIHDTLSSTSDFRTLCMQASGRPRIVKGSAADPCTNS